MKIWINIGHPAQLNFYKNAIKELANDNLLFVTVIDRGKLVRIANEELGHVENCTLLTIGKHSGNKFSAIFEANVLRLLKLYKFCFKNQPELALGNGYLHGVIGKSFGFPAIMFSDDIERKLGYFLMNTFSTEIYYVKGSESGSERKNLTIFNSLKEWAYLAPKYFIPDDKVLSKYDVKPNEYIFVREVITGTLNYSAQSNNIIASVATEFPEGYKVILSLEDKATIDHYPKDWILLQEPVEDIHSLLYYSRVVVSSGDSMAREGSILGVPSIYCGMREMKANKVMIEKGKLVHEEISRVPELINELTGKFDKDDKDKFRNELDHDWIDVSEFIVERVNSYKKKKYSNDNQS